VQVASGTVRVLASRAACSCAWAQSNSPDRRTVVSADHCGPPNVRTVPVGGTCVPHAPAAAEASPSRPGRSEQ
jgi:hypothetical protein